MALDDNRPLNLDDLDPRLAKLAREKINSVLPLVSAGWEQQLATIRERRVAEQAAERNGDLPVISVSAHERADSAIKAHAREHSRSRAGRIATLCGWTIGYVIFAFAIGNVILLAVNPELPYLAVINYSTILAVIAAIFPIRAARRKRRNPSLTLVSRVLPSVANSPGEQAYSAAVSEVAAAQSALGTREATAILTSLNSLLESERAATTYSAALSRATQDQTLTALEAERDRLRARRDSTEDALARKTFDESLEMCEGRLDRARGLAPLRERIEAQQESIRQTMASVQTSLAGLSIASMDTFASETTSGSRAILLDTTRDLQTRALAVEKAVQEVAMLRVG